MRVPCALSWYAAGGRCTCWLQRKYENDIINVVATQFFITTLATGVWGLWVENPSPADILGVSSGRLGADFGLLLAAVATKLIVSQTLPPVTYQTLLEKCECPLLRTSCRRSRACCCR